mgnify:CR=1 FL=1
MNKRRWLGIAVYVVVALLAATSCGGDDDGDEAGGTTTNAAANMPTSIGAGEGRVDLINWAGYVEKDWVTPFEQQTGCKVNSKVGATSDEMVTLMKTGNYDGVSASGDATLRLIAGGDYDLVNPRDGQVAGRLAARAVFQRIGRAAWRTELRSSCRRAPAR